MKAETLWSLRLGFSTKEALLLSRQGIASFLEKSFDAPLILENPSFLAEIPKSQEELKNLKKSAKELSGEAKSEILKQQNQLLYEMKFWWLQKMTQSEYPLRQKMTCFWHNHFVSTFQKVKVNYWIFQHHQLLEKEAFGNFKELTKKVIYTNAMVKYLDNVDNKKNNLNENLSRELLELFTLGIGNYSETDIKNGAKGLAGLGIGIENAQYRTKFSDNEPFEYLGKKGTFKIDQMIDIIFEQPKIPYLITRKILKWFIYDTPPEKLVKLYGDYFKKNNFEIKPLLIKIFSDEFHKKTFGSKIKSPLEFGLQILETLNVTDSYLPQLPFFLKDQGMDLFNQPNVKGWDGGTSWMTAQTYLQRQQITEKIIAGKNIYNRPKITQTNLISEPKTNWNKEQSNLDIIQNLTDNLLFENPKDLQQTWESILKYDFDPSAPTANFTINRLFLAMAKMPEFQLI